MLEIPFEGGCHCGAVRYRCAAPAFIVYTCHCRACQHITGSAFGTFAQVPAEALAVTRGTAAEQVREADSGNRLTTSFCGSCGSALFVANAARPRIRACFVGTLDRAGDAEVRAHIWTKRRLPWVVLPPEHRVFEGAGDWRADYASDPSRLESE